MPPVLRLREPYDVAGEALEEGKSVGFYYEAHGDANDEMLHIMIQVK